MKRTIILWSLAFIITASTAVYQRITGPTYPISGEVNLDGEIINYKLLRTHEGNSSHKVEIEVPADVEGKLIWKRFKSFDDWQIEIMNRDGKKISASFPGQPAAGKIIYYVKLKKGNTEIDLPKTKNVVLRFKGPVPTFILIIHVIAMFGAMLLSTRTGLEIFNNKDSLNKLTYWTIGFLFVGGFILGPIVQKYAFDAYWTGFPFGYDLTDNKTAIALIAWLIACSRYKKSKNPKRVALIAAIVLLLVYLIPHSVLGSEIDYTKSGKKISLMNK